MKNYEKLLAKYNELTEGKKATGAENYFKIPEGVSRVRVLPAKNDEHSFFAEKIVHGYKIDGKYTSVLCSKPAGEDCPVDNFISELWKQHQHVCKVNGWDNKKQKTPFANMASAIKGKERYLLNIVDRADDKSVKILEASKTLFQKILGAICSVDENGEPEYGDITDLQKGRDFKIESKKKPGADFVTYDDSVPAAKVSMAGKPDQIELWMDSLHDINSMVQPSSNDALSDFVSKLRVIVEAEFEEFKASVGGGGSALASKMKGEGE